MDKHLTVLWSNVLADIKPTISQGNFVSFFKPTFLDSLDDDIATIAAPSPIIMNLLQQRFAPTIKQLLDKHTGREISLFFIVKAPIRSHQQEEKEGPLFASSEEIGSKQIPAAPLVGHLPRVRPEYTFSTFAVSSSNQLAFVSAT